MTSLWTKMVRCGSVSWNGVYRFSGNYLTKIKNIDSPIRIIHPDNIIQAMGPKGLWFIEKDQATQQEMPYAHSVRSLLPDKNNGLWIATDIGLYHHTPEELLLFQNEYDLLGAALTDMAYGQDGKPVDRWPGRHYCLSRRKSCRALYTGRRFNQH